MVITVLPKQKTFFPFKKMYSYLFTHCIFVCRLNNVFIIGKGSKPYVSLPRGKGVKLSIAEERDKRLAAKTQ
jgi:hypothetical protein